MAVIFHEMTQHSSLLQFHLHLNKHFYDSLNHTLKKTRPHTVLCLLPWLLKTLHYIQLFKIKIKILLKAPLIAPLLISTRFELPSPRSPYTRRNGISSSFHLPCSLPFHTFAPLPGMFLFLSILLTTHTSNLSLNVNCLGKHSLISQIRPYSLV